MNHAMAVAAMSLLLLMTVPRNVTAQTAPSQGQPQNSQSPSSVTISPVQSSTAPGSGLPANVLTPATTKQLGPGSGAPGRTPVFSGAGQGLPGMSGGPPVNSSLGARDPATQYMRPPTVGPLMCDPAVDVAC